MPMRHSSMIVAARSAGASSGHPRNSRASNTGENTRRTWSNLRTGGSPASSSIGITEERGWHPSCSQAHWWKSRSSEAGRSKVIPKTSRGAQPPLRSSTTPPSPSLNGKVSKEPVGSARTTGRHEGCRTRNLNAVWLLRDGRELRPPLSAVAATNGATAGTVSSAHSRWLRHYLR